MQWFSARWFKITAPIFSFLLIAAPAAFSVWWYMFSSTPPYQWFAEHGLPHWMNNALWAVVVMPVIIGLVLLVLIWRGLSSRSEATVKTELSKEPKLTIECGPTVEGSVAQAWWTINGEPMPVNFFRVVVNATKESQMVKNCTGFLTRIEKDRKTKWGGNNAQVTFAQGEEPDAVSKTIRYPVAEYLDVLAVTSRNQVFPGTKPTIGLRLWPFVPSMDEIFSWLGDYLITVVITGDGVMPPITALLKFNWTGNWETAALTLIQESTAVQVSHIQELEHKPLTGIRLRNECDKWIESGKALRERLVMEGKAAIPEAKRWIQEFQIFAERNLSVSDFDAVNAVTHEDIFNLEMTKVDPSHEAKTYQRLVGHRYGQLSIIRNKIK